MAESKDKLMKMKQQRDQLSARIQKMEASEKSKERKRETQRKILVGAYYLDKAKKDNTYSELVSLLDGFLTRASDRKLFGLEDKETT